MNNNNANEQSEMSAEDSVSCLSLMVGFVAYAIVLWFLLPKSVPQYVSTFVLVLCLGVSHVIVKKHRQKSRLTETIFTAEKRAEWLKIRKSGLIKYILLSILRFAGLLTLVLSFLDILRDCGDGRVLSLIPIIKDAASMFAYLSVFAVAIAIFFWWDNADSEIEWQQKKTQL